MKQFQREPLKDIRSTLWEKSIQRLRALDLEGDAAEITPVPREIEQRLSRYIAMGAGGHATKFYVSELTREHLRKTVAFFLALSSDQEHVPFAHAGTGTLNTLVLALLTFIAELKPDTVIFAMEEPEIAVPPHTQQRIAHYLLTKTTQAFVTSHSPFVIERFDPSHTLLLSRKDGVVSEKSAPRTRGRHSGAAPPSPLGSGMARLPRAARSSTLAFQPVLPAFQGRSEPTGSGGCLALDAPEHSSD